jgi:hypothetical protein
MLHAASFSSGLRRRTQQCDRDLWSASAESSNRFTSCTSAVFGSSRTLTAEMFDYRRASHCRIVEFNFNALAFFKVIDPNSIQRVWAEENFVSFLS